jgi:hypothetical protein
MWTETKVLSSAIKNFGQNTGWGNESLTTFCGPAAAAVGGL